MKFNPVPDEKEDRASGRKQFSSQPFLTITSVTLGALIGVLILSTVATEMGL